MKTRKHTAFASTLPTAVLLVLRGNTLPLSVHTSVHASASTYTHLNFSFVCCTISTQNSPYAILLVLHSEHLSLPHEKFSWILNKIS